MTSRSAAPAYAAILLAGFAAVGLWRSDLLLDAARVSLRQVAAPGPGRWRLLGEGALFAVILSLTWRTISARAEPARDLRLAAAAALAGWAAETWGTRAGVWRYYTTERPPLWIVPAWPLGALVVSRVAASLERRLGARVGESACRALYWVLAFSVSAYVLVFCAPWLGTPLGALLPGAAAAALLLGTEPRRHLWPLAAGLACVFLADLWGVTNGCWGYYPQKSGVGAWKGIAFGMCFDTALVVGAIRLTERSLGQRTHAT